VRDQVFDRGPAGRWAQLRCVAVKTDQDLALGELGQVLVDRRIQVDLPLLDQLQRGDGGHHLGHRHDPVLSVHGDRLCAVDLLAAGGALVDDVARIGRDRRDVGYRTPVHSVPQHLVDG
jgi:hypothetical protein